MAPAPDYDDQLLRFMNDRGYIPIRVPSGGLLPPQLCILEGNRYIPLLPLADAVAKKNAVNFDTAAEPAESFGEQQIAKRKAKTGFSFAELLSGWFGTAKLSADATMDDDAEFAFSDLEVRRVLPGKIEQALNMGFDIDRVGRQRFEEGSLHVAYEYLYAGQLKIEYGSRHGAGGGFEGKITHVANISLTAKAEASRRRTGRFDKSKIKDPALRRPVAIAFKAGQVYRDDRGDFRLKTEQAPGYGAGQAQRPPRPYIFRTAIVFEMDVS